MKNKFLLCWNSMQEKFLIRVGGSDICARVLRVKKPQNKSLQF